MYLICEKFINIENSMCLSKKSMNLLIIFYNIIQFRYYNMCDNCVACNAIIARTQ